jgi:amidase
MSRAESRGADVADLDATAQAEAVRTGEVSPLELVESAIARIEKLDSQLNAVIHRHFERARHEATAPLPDGPFRGVPFLLKDLGVGNRAGDPHHWGTRFLRDAGYTAPGTSHLVEKFLAAGLVVVGRTNVPELGAWTTTEPEAYGPTRNPWNTDHSCGGSSGGAAAAVASGMVPMAHASDGGGSIRNPSSQSGLIGLKPTRGRISLGPDTGESWAGMAMEFAVCRSVRDTAGLLDAVAGNMPGDPYAAPARTRPYLAELERDPGTLRIGLLDEVATVSVAPECRRALEEAGRSLAGLGHRVEVSQPEAFGDPELAGPILKIISSCQARDIERFGQALGRRLGPEDMDCDNWAVTEIGRKVTAVEYQASVEANHAFSRRMAAWWDGGFDLFVTPTIPEASPRIGELVPDPATPLAGFMRSGRLTPFMIPFNITGQPAISLPLHWSEAGLPIGVQLVAAFGREDLLIRIARQLEQAVPWAAKRPKVHAAH